MLDVVTGYLVTPLQVMGLILFLVPCPCAFGNFQVFVILKDMRKVVHK